MLTAVIIDDSKFATREISQLLTEASNWAGIPVTLKGTLCDYVKDTYNVEETRRHVRYAIELIDAVQPDLVLLDIEMTTRIDGFLVLRHFENPPFQTIIITSHEDLALAAVDYNVVDVLMKTSSRNELALSLKKLLKGKEVEPRTNKIHVVKNNRHLTIEFEQVGFIAAVDDYTQIYYRDFHPNLNANAANAFYSEILSTKSLKDTLEILPQYFVQCHRSTVVNSYLIESIEKQSEKKDFVIKLIDTQNGNDVVMNLARSRTKEVVQSVKRYNPKAKIDYRIKFNPFY